MANDNKGRNWVAGFGTTRTAAMLICRDFAKGNPYRVGVESDGSISELVEWDATTSKGARLPLKRRRPLVQAGAGEELLDDLVSLVTGEGRFCALSALLDVPEGVDPSEPDEAREAAQAAANRWVENVANRQLHLDDNSENHARDMATVGALCFGFHVRNPRDKANAMFDHVRLLPEYCDVVFAGQVESERAKAFAKELAEWGAAVDTGEDGEPRIKGAIGSPSDTLIFVRYRWPIEFDVESRNGKITQTALWGQRIYTVDAIIEFEPQKVTDKDDKGPQFDEPLPIRPHNWGVVPLVWARNKGADSGETEGSTVFTPAVKSCIIAEDRALSMGSDSVNVNCAPQFHMRDLTIAESDAQIDTETGDGRHSGGVDVVLETRSINPESPGDAELLETSGSGAQMAMDFADKMRARAFATARVFRHNPETAAGVLSGTALRLLMAPSVNLAKGYQGRLSRAYTGVLELARIVAEKLKLAGAEAVSEVVSFEAVWPEPIPNTVADFQQWQTLLSGAVQAGLISAETASRMFASIIGAENPNAEAEKVAAELGALMGAARKARANEQDPPATPPEDPSATEGGDA